MSSEKTEQPTEKKRQDSARKGQSFKSKDLIAACMSLCCIAYLVSMNGLVELMGAYQRVLEQGFGQTISSYSAAVLWIGVKLLFPILLICIVASSLPSLLQTGFALASEALKLNFDALNPVNGFKKLFSWRTLKDLVKTLLYLGSFALAVTVLWRNKHTLLFSQLHSTPLGLFAVWGELVLSLILICLGCIVLILVLDSLAEYFLYIKDIKMDKEEVKREYKEQEGNPEIKAHRRQMHMEILSEQIKSDIAHSHAIVANPTHIAIGIFYRPEMAPFPFISVMETNQRALAVRAYAEKIGVPVVVDVRLARRIYKHNKRYNFVHSDELDEVLRLLTWLEQVENAWVETPLEKQLFSEEAAAEKDELKVHGEEETPKKDEPGRSE